MKIESDCYVTGEATVDHNGDIQIDNIRVNGEKPSEELAEQVYAVIEHEYYGEILESMPTDDDLRSLHDDARWDEYYQSDRHKRRVA